jgi:hypothetical protein
MIPRWAAPFIFQNAQNACEAILRHAFFLGVSAQ